MEVTVKAFLQVPGGTKEVRRFSLILNQDGTMFQVLASKIATAFPGLKDRNIIISWQDSDGDYIIMSSDEELQDALTQASNSVLKVFVSGGAGSSKNQDAEMIDQDEAIGNDWTNSVRHDREMPPNPIFCGHGGLGRMRGRGFHHGPHKGRFHGPGFPRPFFAPCFMSEENPVKGEKRAWKQSLRESVPVKHRRWAKIYIHNWRNQNLANVTTTSTDSEREQQTKALTKEAAGVPEAYVVWLDMILPKFHQSWEHVEPKDEADSLATLRMSVPVEFRQWVQWFLTKRYGKRCQPELKKCRSEEARGSSETRERCGRGKGQNLGKHGRCGGKGKWAQEKLGPLAKQVPRPVRLWAKHLIFTWQLEQQIPGVRPEMSDSEEVDLPVQSPGIHEDYGRWLLLFLPHWHAKRGLFDPSKVERTPEQKAHFKATVPKEFREWVKCYLAKHLHRQNRPMNKEISTEQQRWLEVFKKKWLQQKEATSALLWTSASEDDGQDTSDQDAQILISEVDTDSEVNSSFKRMKLDVNKHKTVQFVDDSDSDASSIWGKKPCLGFRQSAKDQLANWDGVSTIDETDETEGDEIPPHIHRWLCRMMIKMEERKMRKMKQAAKRETRLAKKELKAIARAQKHSQS